MRSGPDVADVVDVVVVGSALAGLVAAAILTRHGKRVVVLEHADTVGGRGGGVRTPDGYWIDFGHRDGHDVGDCQFPWYHGVDAARDAGVDRLAAAHRPAAARASLPGRRDGRRRRLERGGLPRDGARRASSARRTPSPSSRPRWRVFAAPHPTRWRPRCR